MDDAVVPIVVEIRTQGRGRQRVLVLSDGRRMICGAEACLAVGVQAGASADDALFAALEDADRHESLHNAALRLLSVRGRSRAEIRRRLAMRGVPPAEIDSELERLERVGLLNDEAFARSWVAGRQATRGRRLLRSELAAKGIAADSIASATEEIDDTEAALALARSRARGSALADFETFLKRVGGMLRRRGFDYATALAATRTAWIEATGKPASED